ncbi:hypothetical protein WHR41_09513 [Cladosporium halotolerans]|uniref:Protein kinase domain-containing protein n=1 Tax=Cladosporium halotolerans TaxID=1052096 RepID=A0AB34KD08_9PEZI
MLSRYGKAADVWSSGCVLAEMLGKRVLFPGQGYVHQLDCIFAILGSPTDEDLASGYSVKSIDDIRKVLPVRQKLPWREVHPHASQASLDLLDRLLTFNTERRISTGDAARHVYVRGWADENPQSWEQASSQRAFVESGGDGSDATARCDLFNELIRVSDRSMCSRLLLQLSAGLEARAACDDAGSTEPLGSEKAANTTS